MAKYLLAAPDEQMKLWKKAASGDGMSFAQWVRLALDNYVGLTERERPSPKPGLPSRSLSPRSGAAQVQPVPAVDAAPDSSAPDDDGVPSAAARETSEPLRPEKSGADSVSAPTVVKRQAERVAASPVPVGAETPQRVLPRQARAQPKPVPAEPKQRFGRSLGGRKKKSLKEAQAAAGLCEHRIPLDKYCKQCAKSQGAGSA